MVSSGPEPPLQSPGLGERSPCLVSAKYLVVIEASQQLTSLKSLLGVVVLSVDTFALLTYVCNSGRAATKVELSTLPGMEASEGSVAGVLSTGAALITSSGISILLEVGAVVAVACGGGGATDA